MLVADNIRTKRPLITVLTDFRWSNLLLPSSASVSCGWLRRALQMDKSFDIILLYLSTCAVLRGHPRTELAIIKMLSRLFMSVVELLLQQAPTQKILSSHNSLKMVQIGKQSGISPINSNILIYIYYISFNVRDVLILQTRINMGIFHLL